eukprot:gene35126-58022_t
MDDPLNAGTVRELSGRLPNTPSEVVLDPALADDFGVGIGDELTFVRPAQTFTVVGLADIGGDTGYPAVLAPGFDLSVLRPTAINYEVLVTHPSLAAEAAAINGGTPIPPVEPFSFIELRTDDPAFGIWRDREDTADVAAWLSKIRQPRYNPLTMLVDTDVLIWHLRGYPNATRRLDELGALTLSSISWLEILQGMRSK